MLSSATEMDALLEAVMERMQGSPIVEEQMGYYTEHVQVSDDPAWRFECSSARSDCLWRSCVRDPI
jgi:hypothetical protein